MFHRLGPKGAPSYEMEQSQMSCKLEVERLLKRLKSVEAIDKLLDDTCFRNITRKIIIQGICRGIRSVGLHRAKPDHTCAKPYSSIMDMGGICSECICHHFYDEVAKRIEILDLDGNATDLMRNFIFTHPMLGMFAYSRCIMGGLYCVEQPILDPQNVIYVPAFASAKLNAGAVKLSGEITFKANHEDITQPKFALEMCMYHVLAVTKLVQSRIKRVRFNGTPCELRIPSVVCIQDTAPNFRCRLCYRPIINSVTAWKRRMVRQKTVPCSL